MKDRKNKVRVVRDVVSGKFILENIRPNVLFSKS